MKITKFRVKNYKSWFDSGEIILKEGVNVIVGQNNAGKTALLEALSLKLGYKPHASLETKPHPGHLLNNISSFDVDFELSGREFKSLFLNPGTQNHVMIPAVRTDIAAARSLAGVKQYLNLERNQIISAEFTNGALLSARFQDAWYDPHEAYIQCSIDSVEGKIDLVSTQFYARAGNSELIEMWIARKLPDNIFFFHAERFAVGKSQIQNNKVLQSNCSNLPQVLHYLYTENPIRFKKFYSLVQKVFPNITQITIPPVDNHHANILIWFHDPESERADLAIPILEGGTGIGQVFAMLYVLVTAETPQIFLIDEPQSFLHPGAIRSLLEIFQLKKEHQYIITTHAPAIISMASGSVVQVSHNGSQSSAKVFDSQQSTDTALILNDLGAKLSDIFGADSIMWVEGPTEENCFKKIISHFHDEPLWGVQIIGVSATGDLQGKNAKRVFQIYKKLTSSTALIPPAIAFIFDSEQLTGRDKEDLIRESQQTMQFIDRRMYENYLIYPEAIKDLINELDTVRSEPLTEAAVKEFIISTSKDAFSEPWLLNVHGADLLQKIFVHFTEQRVNYEKVQYGMALTKMILERKPSQLEDVYKVIKRVLDK